MGLRKNNLNAGKICNICVRGKFSLGILNDFSHGPVNFQIFFADFATKIEKFWTHPGMNFEMPWMSVVVEFEHQGIYVSCEESFEDESVVFLPLS